MFFCKTRITFGRLFYIVSFLLSLIFSTQSIAATTFSISPSPSYNGAYTLSWSTDDAGIELYESTPSTDIKITSGAASGSYAFTGKAPGTYEYFLYTYSRTGMKTKTSHQRVNVVPSKVGNPTINPNGGTYTGSTNVALWGSTSGSTIRYTTNGTSVTSQSSQYTGLIPLATNTTIKAKAFLAGAQDSDEVSATFYFKALAPTINPGSTTFSAPANITLSANTANSVIRYTTDGSAVTSSSAQYTSPIYISVNTTLRAKAYVNNMLESDEATASFLVRTTAPGFNPGATTFTGSGNISLVPNEAGSTIRFTTNGSSVTEASSIYTAPISIKSSTTIRAKSFKSGKLESPEVSSSYSVNFGFSLPATSTNGEFDIIWGGVRSHAELWRSGATSDTLLSSGGPGTTSFHESVTESGTYYYFMQDCIATSGSPQLTCTRIPQQSIVVTFPQLATPTITPNGAAFAAPTTVTLTSPEGATLRYTTNNTAVTKDSTAYTGPILISANTKIRVRAFKTKMTTSNEASADFSVQAAAPSLSPASGTNFISSGTVTLSSNEPGTSLRYTTDGSSVTTSSTLYSQPIAITKNTTVKAKAFKTGMENSNEQSATYTVTAATPTMLPNGGKFNGSASVTLATTTTGASIRYTTDGSTVTASSLLYSSPIVITSNTTIKAKAFKTDVLTSGEASVPFQIAALAPAFSQGTGTYSAPINVTLTTGTLNSTIRYTIDGSAVTSSSPQYLAPITISTNSKLRAKTYAPNMQESDETVADYLIRVAAPGFNPTSTTFTGPGTISLVSNEAGSTIRFTTDGSSVTEASTLYTAPISVSRNTTVRAKSFKSGKLESTEVSSAYTVNFGFNLPATSATGEFDITWGGTHDHAELWRSESPNNTMLFSGLSATTFHETVTESGTYYYFMKDCTRGGGSTLNCINTDVKNITVTFPQLATPTITPNGATFASPTTVTLASPEGATLRYTTNNTAVTKDSTAYTGPILISANTKIRVRAFKTKMTTSNEASADFSVQAAAPSLSPASGTNFISSGTVTLSSNESGASLRYTTDGSSVTASSTLYSQPIAITTNTTVKAKAFKSGLADSTEASATYTVTVVAPTISPSGATFKGSGQVSLATTTPGANIRYTLNGSTVTASSPLYSSPIVISENTTLKAKAFKTDALPSSEVSASFQVAALPPTFNPNGASFPGSGQVLLAPQTSGSVIRYSTDGSSVTSGSTLYSGAISINSRTTVKAKAFKTGMLDSEEVSALFIAGSEGQPATLKYTYDALGRLKEVKENNADKTKYKYDPAGNRTSVTEAPLN